MRTAIGEFIREHPVLIGFAVIALTGVLALSCLEAVRWVQWRAFDARVQAALAVAPSGDTRTITLDFEAFGEEHVIDVHVDEAEYAAVSTLPAEEAFRWRGRWRDRYVTSFVGAMAESRFIGELATELRWVARHSALDDDEYLELLVAAVQSMHYARSGDGIRTPIEVLMDGEGVCTERSVLLGTLLVREGFDTVMWSFRSQKHVALGVATNGPSFRDSGYAFIETTGPAYIGQTDSVYRSSGPIFGPPEQIALGGHRAYGAGFESAYVLMVLDRAERQQAHLAEYSGYVDSVKTYRHAGEFGARAEERTRAAGIVDFITSNVGDRPAVFQVLCEQGPTS